MNDQQQDFRKAMDSLNPADYVSETMTSQSSFWTPEELAAGAMRFLARYVRAGWKYAEGWLTHGDIKTRVGFIPPGSFPGDPSFNPRKDAFAIRIGAVFERPGRYRHELGLMNADGSFADEDECPECGGNPWNVRIPVLDNWGKPLIPLRFQNTYCRRCVSREEAEEAMRRRTENQGGRQVTNRGRN